MSYVQEGLYLGSADDAYNTSALLQKGITHILTVEQRPLTQEAAQNFTCKHVYALDMESQDLLSHIDECIQFIEDGRKNGSVLVHCLSGVSRSGTVVLAFIMHKLDIGLDDAYALVRKQRALIEPNPGFRSQLELFEAMGNRIDNNNEQYKIYKLDNLAQKMQAAQLHAGVLQEALIADPSLNPSHSPTDTMFKCKKCRRALFKKSGVLPHETGRGNIAFDWRAKMPVDGNQTDNVSRCTQSLFIEPVQWMAQAILELEGKILCPKCSAKLGSFNWCGERCSCGTWITPAFHIQTSKVDESRLQQVAPMPSRPIARVQPFSVRPAENPNTSQASTSYPGPSGDSAMSDSSNMMLSPTSGQSRILAPHSGQSEMHKPLTARVAPMSASLHEDE